MKASWIYLIFGATLLLTVTSLSTGPSNNWNEETPVYKVLFKMGAEKPDHYLEKITDAMVQQGYEIVFEGKTKDDNGKSTGYVSKYYSCTSCHNVVREDPVLNIVDQDARLNFAKSNNIPYLQGSTFWGLVNRETWYNDDYVKKYGDLVIKANKSLQESIQLCATVCSQGRALSDWEMKVVLAYFWSLQLKLSDLELSTDEWESLRAAEQSDHQHDEVMELLKKKYLLKSPATFIDPPEDKKPGYGLVGRPEKGEDIFNLSCRHCHRPKGESDVVFDDSKATYRWLNKHKLDNTQLSIYEIIRHGTYAEHSHKEYMPLYTEEKMSNQQVEDFRAFIESKVKKKK